MFILVGQVCLGKTIPEIENPSRSILMKASVIYHSILICSGIMPLLSYRSVKPGRERMINGGIDEDIDSP